MHLGAAYLAGIQGTLKNCAAVHLRGQVSVTRKHSKYRMLLYILQEVKVKLAKLRKIG